MLQFVLGHRVERRERTERFGAFQVQADVVGEISGTIGQVGGHLPDEFFSVLDLHRPVQFPLLADERERRVGNGAPAERAGAVRGINFHLIRQSENLVKERIVKFARERVRIFIGIAQVGTADVAYEKQVAGEDGGRLAAFMHEKRKAVRRMARRFEQLDLERADLDAVAIFRRDVLVVHRREMRNVNFRAGPRRASSRKPEAKSACGWLLKMATMRKSFALRLGEVIIDIAFRIDHGGLTVGAEKIGSMSESFDKEAF